MLIIYRKGKKEGKEGKEGKERGTGARVCTSTRRGSTSRYKGCTSLYEYHPNRQRDLEGTSTIRGNTSRYKGCTSLYEYHPSLPKSQREGTSKGEGRYEKKGTGGYE